MTLVYSNPFCFADRRYLLKDEIPGQIIHIGIFFLMTNSEWRLAFVVISV